MTANDFVQKYHKIQVPEFAPSVMYRLFGTKLVPAPVKQYVNLDLADSDCPNMPPKSQRMAFKDRLLDFFGNVSRVEDSGIIFKGSHLQLLCSVRPLMDFKKEWFMACFGGKAAPDAMAGMVQLMSYYRGWKTLVEGRTNIPSLEQMVSDNLGVDCNGFVGAYIREKFPATGVVPSTISASYDQKAKVKRLNPYDLADDDIIVFNVRHIAVINFVEIATDSEALVEVSESRTARVKNGGPQTNTFTLKRSKGEWKFSPTRSKSVKSIVRINGMA